MNKKRAIQAINHFYKMEKECSGKINHFCRMEKEYSDKIAECNARTKYYKWFCARFYCK